MRFIDIVKWAAIAALGLASVIGTKMATANNIPRAEYESDKKAHENEHQVLMTYLKSIDDNVKVLVGRQ